MLTSSGTANYPIVYRRMGRGPATLNLNNAGQAAVNITGAYVELHGLTITNVNEDGILADGDYGVIADCRILGVVKRGIEADGNYCLFYRNVIYQPGQEGIRIQDAGKNSMSNRKLVTNR